MSLRGITVTFAFEIEDRAVNREIGLEARITRRRYVEDIDFSRNEYYLTYDLEKDGEVEQEWQRESRLDGVKLQKGKEGRGKDEKKILAGCGVADLLVHNRKYPGEFKAGV